jgi:hypothetical protein
MATTSPRHSVGVLLLKKEEKVNVLITITFPSFLRRGGHANGVDGVVMNPYDTAPYNFIKILTLAPLKYLKRDSVLIISYFTAFSTSVYIAAALTAFSEKASL